MPNIPSNTSTKYTQLDQQQLVDVTPFESKGCNSFNDFSPDQMQKFKMMWCDSIRNEIAKLAKKQKKAMRNLRNAAEGKPLEV